MDSNQPTTPTYPSPQPSLLSGRNIFIGLAVLIIILITVLSLITGKKSDTTKTPSETISQMEKPTTYPTAAETKGSYKNTIYGFHFNYPPEFTAKNVSSDIISVSSLDTPPNPDAPATGLQITVSKGDKTLTNLDLAKGIFQTPVVQDTTVGGIPAKELKGNGKSVLNGKFIRFVEVYKNGQTIEFAYFEGEPDFTQEVLASILSSFTFTK